MQAACLVGSARSNGSTSFFVDTLIRGMKDAGVHNPEILYRLYGYAGRPEGKAPSGGKSASLGAPVKISDRKKIHPPYGWIFSNYLKKIEFQVIRLWYIP